MFLDDMKTIATRNNAVAPANVVLSTKATVPTTGTYVVLTEYGGPGPDYIQNQVTPIERHPAAQVMVRGDNYLTCRTIAESLYLNYVRVKNELVNNVWYRRISPQQEPFDLGLDDTGKARVVFNVIANKGAAT
jgi:hypothetical protein